MSERDRKEREKKKIKRKRGTKSTSAIAKTFNL